MVSMVSMVSDVPIFLRFRRLLSRRRLGLLEGLSCCSCPYPADASSCLRFVFPAAAPAVGPAVAPDAAPAAVLTTSACSTVAASGCYHPGRRLERRRRRCSAGGRPRVRLGWRGWRGWCLEPSPTLVGLLLTARPGVARLLCPVPSAGRTLSS